jgi:phosphatidylglycerol lysyltransferase
MFTQFYDPGLQPLTGFGRYFANSIYVIGVSTFSYALLMLIRPVLIRQPATPAERTRAKAIVEAYGRASLARLTLLDDKSYYFSPGGSMVAYVARGDAALALGDPIGPAEDIALTIKGFVDFCRSNDWQPAFHETLPDYLEHYQAAGLRTLPIGYAGRVELATFTLAGKANQGLRTPMNRMTRQGFRAEIHQPPLSEELLADLRAISDEWLTMVHGTEKRFMLGWFDDDYIRSGRVIAVHPPEGPISAFANIIPEYQRNEVTVDLMRRRAQVENGTMDFLFVSLCEWAKAEGYASFSLGLSPLWRVGEEEDDPRVERALHYIYENLNQFYNFKGLHAYKEKFHPDWSPRYLIYSGPASLPAVLTTLVRVSSGDNFVWDYLKNLAQPLVKERSSGESVKQSTD